MKLLDISVPVHPRMHQYPDDPIFTTEVVKSLENGDVYEYHLITMGNHCGTHIDAPAHFFEGGATIEEIPLEQMNGRCRVIQIHNVERIDVPELKQVILLDDVRILFKTRNSLIWTAYQSFQSNYVHLSEQAAEYLVDKRIKLIGIDYLSVDRFGTDHPVHRILLKNGIVIVEGLNLAQVDEGEYDMSCLPLALKGLDAAPARVVLRG